MVDPNSAFEQCKNAIGPRHESPVVVQSEEMRMQKKYAHELAMHAAYKACGMAEDIAGAYNTAYKIVMEANHG